MPTTVPSSRIRSSCPHLFSGLKLMKGQRFSSRYRWCGELRVVGVLSLLLFIASFSPVAGAQQKETSLPLSQRKTINLAAGVPQYIADATSASAAPQSQSWYQDTTNSATYATPGFLESGDSAVKWQQVGLPYDANVKYTFINQAFGGGAGSLAGADDNWYRLHF